MYMFVIHYLFTGILTLIIKICCVMLNNEVMSTGSYTTNYNWQLFNLGICYSEELHVSDYMTA